ncbi:MAG: molybdopterin-dependent oxidoreductase [Anaerolineaceae bacterium]|nr:molybdopterin-dependent oxidoreductase [Anaerolineaceae bacterium]
MENSFLARKEEENKMRELHRLPPGQTLTNKFPVLHYGAVPAFDPASWNFQFYGEVEKALTFSWAEFSQLPRRTLKMDIHCVTRWSKFDTEWEGISVSDLITSGLLRLKPGANFVIQHAEYDFSANLPLQTVLADNFLLATHFNGAPITPDHGFPVRGIVGAIPGREELAVPYFWKGAKWLRSLEFTVSDHPGFWESAGYHNEADVWKEERFG